MVKASITLIPLLLILHVHFMATLPVYALEERNMTMLPSNISRHKLEKRNDSSLELIDFLKKKYLLGIREICLNLFLRQDLSYLRLWWHDFSRRFTTSHFIPDIYGEKPPTDLNDSIYKTVEFTNKDTHSRGPFISDREGGYIFIPPLKVDKKYKRIPYCPKLATELDDKTFREVLDSYHRLANQFLNLEDFFRNLKEWAKAFGLSMKEAAKQFRNYRQVGESSGSRFICGDEDNKPSDDINDELRK
ncbi:3940_t:CDS:2 [Gigaspora margarita]|uniref:3940_t:CDS:1 n=1 Tax=Gigaspora margarita TaxID=4874 RepID=A0ABN7VXZ2_GIGMA|nr:3940_t:CDS:2 [Gigaspora margarita]